VYKLLKRVGALGFDTPEIGLLENIATQAEATKAKAQKLLEKLPSLEPVRAAIPSSSGDDAREAENDPQVSQRDRIMDEIRALLAGYNLSIHLEELSELEEFCNKMLITTEIESLLSNEGPDGSPDVETLSLHLDLPARARACNYDMSHPIFDHLHKVAKTVDEDNNRTREVLSRPVKSIEDLEKLLGLVIDHQLESKLKQTHNQALTLQRQAEAWLNPKTERPVKLPDVQEALKLVQRAEKEFSIDAIGELKRSAEFAYDLEERCERVLKNRYQPEEDASVFETITRWREYADKHLTGIFALPNYDLLLKQLQLHEQWITKLPWWCAEHEKPHSQEIVEDVVKYTKQADDAPPDDEYFTCICFEPVRKPPPGVTSDAVQCDHCFARFHGRCAKNGGSCPFCDPNHWNGSIHRERSWHSCYLPTVLHNAPEITKNYSPDWKDLKVIVEHIDRLCSVVGHFLKHAQEPANQRLDLIPQVRHYMRKLFKIQFAVSPNPEVSFGLDLAGLHRILAYRPAPVRIKKRRRPRFGFGQDVDKDWIDGTRCICRGRTDYLRGYAIVECENPTCNRRYHTGCVCFTGQMTNGGKTFFTCPLCCLRKGKPYRYADVRVKDFREYCHPSHVEMLTLT
jgi:histone demethylase JARID1